LLCVPLTKGIFLLEGAPSHVPPTQPCHTGKSNPIPDSNARALASRERAIPYPTFVSTTNNPKDALRGHHAQPSVQIAKLQWRTAKPSWLRKHNSLHTTHFWKGTTPSRWCENKSHLRIPRQDHQHRSNGSAQRTKVDQRLTLPSPFGLCFCPTRRPYKCQNKPQQNAILSTESRHQSHKRLNSAFSDLSELATSKFQADHSAESQGIAPQRYQVREEERRLEEIPGDHVEHQQNKK